MAEDTVISSTRVVLLGMVLVTLGSIGFHAIPGLIDEEAAGTRWVNAVYCCVITLTTVGFGDICPSEISDVGRLFIVVLAFSGMGMFCGPIMDLTSSWKDNVPVGGDVALLTFVVSSAVMVFSYLLEEMSHSEAAYFSIVTGTTIGFGDVSPKTDAGKIAVALYAILAVNVVASLLQPAKEFLLRFCLVPAAKELEKKQRKAANFVKVSNQQSYKPEVTASTKEDLAEAEKDTTTTKKRKKKKKISNGDKKKSQ